MRIFWRSNTIVICLYIIACRCATIFCFSYESKITRDQSLLVPCISHYDLLGWYFFALLCTLIYVRQTYFIVKHYHPSYVLFSYVSLFRDFGVFVFVVAFAIYLVGKYGFWLNVRSCCVSSTKKCYSFFFFFSFLFGLSVHTVDNVHEYLCPGWWPL